MKFFQKRGVAIAVLILAIIASGAWGLHKAPAVSTPEGGEKLDPSLSTAAFTQYVRDDAGVLSDKTEEAIGLYNANWDKMFGSIMAVVTTESANDIENAAYDYAIEMQLAENDAILVIAKQQQDYYLLASGNFYDLLSRLSQSFVASCMADNVQKGDYDAAVRSLCAALHVELSQQYQQSEAALDEAANGVMFIMILVIFFIIWIMLDGMRYRRYRRRYMMPGMGIPTVVYHPIFWGRRPPRGPRPPRSGGPRPPRRQLRRQSPPAPAAETTLELGRFVWRLWQHRPRRRLWQRQCRWIRQQPRRWLRWKPRRRFWRKPRRFWRRPRWRLWRSALKSFKVILQDKKHVGLNRRAFSVCENLQKNAGAKPSLLRHGAGDRTRTGTLSPAADFESCKPRFPALSSASFHSRKPL